MKWFFALNESGKDFSQYADLAKVAVYTALRQTSLEPHFIYDGGEDELTQWLRKKNVRIINARSFIYEELKTEAARRDNEGYWHIGAGAFLRLEIPEICLTLKIFDQFVLYTDVDVMFQADAAESLERIKPKFFAVAPEFFKIDYNGINTGVMIMNLPSLRAENREFKSFVKKNLSKLIDDAFDQGAYKAYYKRNRLLRKIIGNKWDKLPIEYNWKPYWGSSANAKIIHFHGPKPYQTKFLQSNEAPAHLKYLTPLMTESYFEYEEEWRQELIDANRGD